MKDKNTLLTDHDGMVIEYLPYLDAEKFDNAVKDTESLYTLRNMILNHVYSLRKDVRWLKKRI